MGGPGSIPLEELFQGDWVLPNSQVSWGQGPEDKVDGIEEAPFVLGYLLQGPLFELYKVININVSILHWMAVVPWCMIGWLVTWEVCESAYSSMGLGLSRCC